MLLVILIGTLVVCTVAIASYQHGRVQGINIGRQQVLNEDLIRLDKQIETIQNSEV